MATIMLLSYTAINAQIKNAKTASVKIYGNCGMCETTIEKAGNKKKIAKVDWNEDTKMATITYDSKKTSQDIILKAIALSGYDNEKFLAPNNVYANLPECCQYERKAKTIAKVEATKTGAKEGHMMHNHSDMTEAKQDVSQLKAVFESYFDVKDALVKTNGNAASAEAKKLLAAINAVKMEKLSTKEHTIWMKVMQDLALHAENIANTKVALSQRDHFTTLSKNIYALIKVSKTENPTYYQFCPMYNDGKGAYWLSKENAVKNPYYGSQMLSCGKTVETIK